MGIVVVRLKKRRIKRDIIKNKSEQAKKEQSCKPKRRKKDFIKKPVISYKIQLLFKKIVFVCISPFLKGTCI